MTRAGHEASGLSARDARWSAASQLLLPASTFVAVPLIIGPLDVGGFARAMLLVAISRFLGSIDLGYLTLAIPRIALEEDTRLPRYVTTALARLVVVQGLAAAGITVVVIANNNLGWVPVDLSIFDPALAAATAATYQFATLLAALASVRRHFRAQCIINAASAAVFIAIISTLIDSPGDYRVPVVATAVQFLLAGGLTAVIATRRIEPSAVHNKDAAIPVRGRGFAMQFISTGGVAFNQIPVILATSSLTGAEGTAVAIGAQYGVIFRTLGMSAAPYMLTVLATAPSNSSAWWAAYRRLTRIWIVASAVLAAVAALAAPVAIRVWLGESQSGTVYLAGVLSAITACVLVSTLVTSSALRSALSSEVEFTFVAIMLAVLVAVSVPALWHGSATFLLSGQLVAATTSTIWFQRRRPTRTTQPDDSPTETTPTNETSP